MYDKECGIKVRFFRSCDRSFAPITMRPICCDIHLGLQTLISLLPHPSLPEPAVYSLSPVRALVGPTVNPHSDTTVNPIVKVAVGLRNMKYEMEI